jgi:hypothetical protein
MLLVILAAPVGTLVLRRVETVDVVVVSSGVVRGVEHPPAAWIGTWMFVVVFASIEMLPKWCQRILRSKQNFKKRGF